MRILNRPMFKYGGPIKEGVMHGMKNGGSMGEPQGKNLVGDPVYPKTDGRAHHFAFGGLGLAGLYAGARATLPWIIRQGARYLPKVKRMFGTTTPASITRGGPRVGEAVGSHTPITINPAKFNPNWLGRDPLVRTVGAAGKAIFNPTTGGLAAKGLRMATSPSSVLIGGLWYANGRWFNKKGDELDPNSTEVADAKAGAKWDPGAGADQYDPSTSASALAAAAKKARTEKLSKYLDMMGYDRAKKTAMSDALIDASAIVQQGTEEGGSLKHADWSKMINQAIQTTSKRLDKPEQIREAVGLMMTKGAIDKDIASGKESEAEKTMKLLGISKAEYKKKFLDQKSFAENKVIAFKTRSGQDAIDTAAEITYGPINGNIINVSDFADVYETMKDKTGDDDRTIVIKYTQAEINANPEKFNDGRYTVGENLVTIKDNKVISVE